MDRCIDSPSMVRPVVKTAIFRLLLLSCCAAALLAPPARAADVSGPPSPPPSGEAAPWLRDAALSPDGTRIAFRGAGQIWVAPAAGGDALPLTPAGTYAGHPVWSPDGATVAFASDRFGPLNVFAVPAAGGEARRLTFYERDEEPTGFTPDGSAVLFWAPGLGDLGETGPYPSFREDGRQLYQVPVAGGRDTMVLPNAAMEAQWDPAGRRMLYTGPSIEQPYRRRQLSSAARQVWVYDAVSGGHRRLTQGPHESRNAVWMPDGGVDYLDEASGALNVWHRGADLGHPVQVTRLAGEPVRSLSASRGGDLAFTWDGGLYRLRAGASEPERVAVRLPRTDFPGDRAGRTTALTDFALSPDGREFAVVGRGGISVASIDGRDVKRLPHTAGEERDPTFSADGRRVAYASERDGRWGLYESTLQDPEEHGFAQATRVAERRLPTAAGDAMGPVYSPDGRRIAYLADRSAFRVLDPASGADVEVLPPGRIFSYEDGAWPPAWSPDSRWLAVPVQPSEQIDNVALVPADGSRPAVPVMPAGVGQWDPDWSPDDGLLMWRSDEDALRHAYRDRWSTTVEGAFTSRRARTAYQRRLMVPVAGDQPPTAAERGEPGSPARTTPDPRDAAALRDAAPHGPLAVEAEGMDERGITLSQQPGKTVFSAFMPDGVSLLTVDVSSNARNDGLAVTGFLRDIRQGKLRVLFSGLAYQDDSPVRLSRDRRRLYFLARTNGSDPGTDGLEEVDLGRGTPRLIRIAVDTTRDEAEARRAAFEQFWTLTAKKFYDPAFAGADWAAARGRYARFLPSLGDERELAELLSEMQGELGASHSWSGFRRPVPPAERTASLGLYYDERYPGPGMRVAAIIPGGPLDGGDSALRPGDVIAEVDGAPVPDAGGIRRALGDHPRQMVSLTAVHPDGTRFTETHVTVDLDRERELADRTWEERKRDAVTAASCGRLGYVHLPAMDGASYRRAFSDIFGRFVGAQGLVVDIRDNTGGNLHNHLATLLSGKAYMTVVPPRGGPAQDEPRDRWTKPSAVVMNAESYSDGSLFPLAYRDLGLGTLVGDPVAGTGTFVWWAESRIIPGLVYGVPQLPFRRMDGTLSENHEVEPDIAVPSDPAAWAKGRDPQLDAAVHSLMLDAGGACPKPPAQP